jgi:ABC-type phosphate transport system substrate-binding protein
MNGQRRLKRSVVAAIAGLVLCAGPTAAETASPSTQSEFDRKVDEALGRLRPVSTANWSTEQESETDAMPEAQAGTHAGQETDGEGTGMSAAGVTVAKPAVPEIVAPSVQDPARPAAAEMETAAVKLPPARSGPDPRWIAEQNAASAKLRKDQLSEIESGGGKTAGTP